MTGSVRSLQKSEQKIRISISDAGYLQKTDCSNEKTESWKCWGSEISSRKIAKIAKSRYGHSGTALVTFQLWACRRDLRYHQYRYVAVHFRISPSEPGIGSAYCCRDVLCDHPNLYKTTNLPRRRFWDSRLLRPDIDLFRISDTNSWSWGSSGKLFLKV